MRKREKPKAQGWARATIITLTIPLMSFFTKVVSDHPLHTQLHTKVQLNTIGNMQFKSVLYLGMLLPVYVLGDACIDWDINDGASFNMVQLTKIGITSTVNLDCPKQDVDCRLRVGIQNRGVTCA